jgi:hypothetical protein
LVALGFAVLDHDMEAGVCLVLDTELELGNIGTVGGTSVANEVEVSLEGPLVLVQAGHIIALAVGDLWAQLQVLGRTLGGVAVRVQRFDQADEHGSAVENGVSKPHGCAAAAIG